MIQKKLIAAALLSGGLLVGCTNDEYSGPGARQEGNLDAKPYSVEQQRTTPYNPVMGDTTGDGLRRDDRTGGGITGGDVAPSERVREDRIIDQANPSQNRGAWPRPGTSTGNNARGTDVDSSTAGGGRGASGSSSTGGR